MHLEQAIVGLAYSEGPIYELDSCLFHDTEERTGAARHRKGPPSKRSYG